MQDEVFGAEHQRAFDLAAKGFDGFLEKGLDYAGHVNEVVRVDHHRLQVVLLAQALELVALRTAEFVGRPLARAGRENLKGIAAQAVGTLSGQFNTTCNGGMNSDASRAVLRRTFRSWIV